MPMTLEGKEVKFFNPEEFEDIGRMWAPLIWELDRLREFLGTPIRLHETNPLPSPASSHVPDSRHFHGRAVDCSVKGLALWDFFLAATRFQFTGIGVYPAWNSPGLHLEMGYDLKEIRKYWWRDADGVYRGVSVYDLSTIFLRDVTLDT